MTFAGMRKLRGKMYLEKNRGVVTSSTVSIYAERKDWILKKET